MIFATPVNFHLTDEEELLYLLRGKAAEIDDHNNGSHQTEYTVEQAFTVVWHAEPAWLVERRILVGWTVEQVGLFNQSSIEWEDADDNVAG